MGCAGHLSFTLSRTTNSCLVCHKFRGTACFKSLPKGGQKVTHAAENVREGTKLWNVPPIPLLLATTASILSNHCLLLSSSGSMFISIVSLPNSLMAHNNRRW